MLYFINTLTTSLSSFFRKPAHFDPVIRMFYVEYAKEAHLLEKMGVRITREIAEAVMNAD